MAIALLLARHHHADGAIGKPPIRSVIAAARIHMHGATMLEQIHPSGCTKVAPTI
ncbi:MULTISPECIES: hypothetical protein [Brucella/Ochrobactrum group]|uniref:Uncharacterized protein n=2 Tax=Ochrobactrum TaxID=528 RepID=A0ABD5JZ64_9HYPH|nr:MULTISPECIES: hypothetical protein [Brucella]MCI0998491.1 hypothetical protein [Ochrobactrum sp. C6C9]WHT41579.1 hypothetical protein QLQ11_09235 [Ochrobactrum sp. SSR]MDX4075249.1 hypothetical protein [Brucella sp. NBRC 113783]NNU59310.1 hypothetical protein [[Ochrobactrum] soli]WHS31940.1 hypothetical protein QLQ09_08150 [Brucella sp. NM4]